MEACNRSREGEKDERYVFCFEAHANVGGEEPVLVVVSRDPAGIKRDDYFFTTNTKASPEEVIGLYAQQVVYRRYLLKTPSSSSGGRTPRAGSARVPRGLEGFSFFCYLLIWHWHVSTYGALSDVET